MSSGSLRRSTLSRAERRISVSPVFLGAHRLLVQPQLERQRRSNLRQVVVRVFLESRETRANSAPDSFGPPKCIHKTMNIPLIKITSEMLGGVRKDLQRPHSFARERIGFLVARLSKGAEANPVILMSRYLPIADDAYIYDPTVGARFGTDAISVATEAIYWGRAAREGVFHVHIHAHKGSPSMSEVDAQDLPRLIPTFQSIGPRAPHGIIILSLDHGSAWYWSPSEGRPTRAAISVLGPPVLLFKPEVTIQ